MFHLFPVHLSILRYTFCSRLITPLIRMQSLLGLAENWYFFQKASLIVPGSCSKIMYRHTSIRPLAIWSSARTIKRLECLMDHLQASTTLKVYEIDWDDKQYNEL